MEGVSDGGGFALCRGPACADLLERVLAAAGGAAQLVDLFARQLARGADAQVVEREAAVADARAA